MTDILTPLPPVPGARKNGVYGYKAVVIRPATDGATWTHGGRDRTQYVGTHNFKTADEAKAFAARQIERWRLNDEKVAAARATRHA